MRTLLFAASNSGLASLDHLKNNRLPKALPLLCALLGAPAAANSSSLPFHHALQGHTSDIVQIQNRPVQEIIPAGLPRYRAVTTVFCPEDPAVDRAMQGGMRDRRGRSLHGKSLQDYLEGRGDYVAVAMDRHAFPYGTILRIPELDAHYGKPIIFKVVGTGGAFRNKGTSRIDIMTRSLRESRPVSGHMRVTLIPVHIPDEVNSTARRR